MKESQRNEEDIKLSRVSVPAPLVDQNGEILGALIEFLNGDQKLRKNFEEVIEASVSLDKDQSQV